ncbi:hypothetical protein ACVU7I_11935, partial [Patulibacter sp. S7RM1-6]
MSASPVPRIALATSAEHPHGVDETPLAERLDATWAVWDDPTVDWAAFDLVVVRSTWDYHARREAFLAWAAGVPSLANPADVLAWNTDKRYLADLVAAALPTVPTLLVPPGEALPADAPALAGEVVVKPSVSAGARDTGSSTDAVVPSRAGYPTACLVSFDRSKAMTDYHLPTDVP